MRIVVIGATSAIAEHCCRLWVEREACDLVLVSVGSGDVEGLGGDIEGRDRGLGEMDSEDDCDGSGAGADVGDL